MIDEIRNSQLEIRNKSKIRISNFKLVPDFRFRISNFRSAFCI